MANPSRKLLEAIGASIRQRRKAAGMTLQQLSELAGIDAGFLAYIETGKKSPSLLTAAKIAGALGVELGELFSSVRKTKEGPQYKLERQLHSLFHDRTPDQVEEIASLLRQLRNPKKIKALKQLIGPDS